MTEVPTITLNNGVTIPQLGFGQLSKPNAVGGGGETGHFVAHVADHQRNIGGQRRGIGAEGMPRQNVAVDHRAEGVTVEQRAVGRSSRGWVGVRLAARHVPSKALQVRVLMAGTEKAP